MNYGVDESRTGLETDAGEEYGDSYLTQHQVGAGRGICDDLELGAEMAHQEAHDERATGQAELDRLGYAGDVDRNAAEQASQGYTYEYRHQVGLVEPLARIAEHLLHSGYALLATDHRHLVSVLEPDVGRRPEFDSCPADTRHRSAHHRFKAELAEHDSVEAALGDYDAAGDVLLVAQVLLGLDDMGVERFVAVGRVGKGTHHRLPVEEGLEHDETQDASDHAERVCHGISERDIGFADPESIGIGLLGRTESGSVGHRTRHDTRHRGYRGSGDVMQGEGYTYTEQYSNESQHVEPESAALEAGEETGTDLEADTVDEQDKTEFLEELDEVRIERHAEMAEDDPHE